MFIGPSGEEIQRHRESAEIAPKPKEYKWGYCFVPGGGDDFSHYSPSYYQRVDTKEFIAFKKIISERLDNNYEAFQDYGFNYPGRHRETIRILTDEDLLDILYIKMITNFDLVKKINFEDELASCLERHRLINIYDEEHIDQTIRKMKRFNISRKSFGAKTPQLNRLDSLKTNRKIIPWKESN